VQNDSPSKQLGEDNDKREFGCLQALIAVCEQWVYQEAIA
jgi:hypothetical protein